MEKFNIPLKHKDGYQPRGIKFLYAECLSWGGFGVCDLCGEDIYRDNNKHGYMIEPLGSNGMCQKCYDDFIGRNKLYEEDRYKYDVDIQNYYFDKFNIE